MQVLDPVSHIGQGDLKLQLLQGSLREGANQTRLLLLNGCELPAERGEPCLKLGVAVLVLKLSLDTLQDLAGVREEPSYVRPNDSLKPVARDSRTVKLHGALLVTLL